MMRDVKVLFSSTTLDLPAHRAKAASVCEALGHYGFRAWRMETRPAESLSPKEVSLKWVEEADVYVLVLGVLYGTIPEGEEASITELEYEKAVELRKPILVFQAHPDHDFPGRVHLDPRAHPEKMRRFQERVSRRWSAPLFENAHDFAAKLQTALLHWLGQGQIDGVEPRRTYDISTGPAEPESSRDHEPTIDHRRSTRSPLAWGAAGLLAGLLSVAVLTFTPTATRIRLDLTVDRVVFQVAEKESRPLLTTALGFRRLSLERFGRLEMDFEDQATGQRHSMVLTALNNRARIALEPEVSSRGSLGTFGPPQAEPEARVLLQAHPGGDDVDLTLDLNPATLGISVFQPFRLTAENVQRSGGPVPDGEPLVLRGRLPHDRSALSATSGSSSLKVVASLPASLKQQGLLNREALAVTELKFVKQGTDGTELTTLEKDGLLSYPDQPWLGELILHRQNLLRLEAVDSFHLKNIDIDPRAGTLQLVIEGLAAVIRTESGANVHDYRLSLFQNFFQGPMWAWLLGWVGTAVSLALMLENLWQRKTSGRR